MPRLCAPAKSCLSYTFFRCETKGEYTSSYVRFLKTTSLLARTDQSFRLRTNEQHHTGTSPFESLPSLDMIKHFPVDHMHCVFLGVTRKLLDLWTRGSRAHRLSPSAVSQINERLEQLKQYTPKEFSRKPRTLRDLDRCKATEFRLFPRYTGKIVLEGILPTHLI